MPIMMRTPCHAVMLAALLVLGAPHPAAADWDLSLFVGQAFPTYDDRLVIRLPDVPPVAGLEIEASGTPELRADGGPVFGAALAREFGVLGIEVRLDMTDVALELTGVRYDLRFLGPVFGGGARGSLSIGDARFDADRLRLLSFNARLRTPGAVSLVASGGLSYLPDFDLAGSIPVQFDIEGVPDSFLAQPELFLVVVPEQSNHRWGVNGGAGLRIGGRIAVFAEARVFYFKEYELSLELEDVQPIVSALLDEIEPVRFRPLIANAVAGLVFRF